MSTLAELKDKFKDGAKPSGADFADLINHTESNTVINGKASQSDLTALTTTVNGKADTSALANYATKSDLAGKADVSTLSNYATKNDLSGKADKTELSSYATKTELNAKADTTALASYALKSEIPDVSGLQSKPAEGEAEEVDGYKYIAVEEQTSTTFYDLGETTKLYIEVSDIDQEVIVSFTAKDVSEDEPFDLQLDGEGSIIGSVPTSYTDGDSYIISVLHGNVVMGKIETTI